MNGFGWFVTVVILLGLAWLCRPSRPKPVIQRETTVCTEDRCEEPAHGGKCVLCLAEEFTPPHRTVQERLIDCLANGPDTLFVPDEEDGQISLQYDSIRIHSQHPGQITVTLRWEGQDTWSLKPLDCCFERGDEINLMNFNGSMPFTFNP